MRTLPLRVQSQITRQTQDNGPLRVLSGGYYSPVGTASTTSPLQNFILAAPVFLPKAATINQLGIEVTAAGEAGSVLRFGVYDDNGSGYPRNLLLSTATAATDTTGAKTVAASLTVPRGLLWLALVVQLCPTTRPTVRSITGPVQGLALSAAAQSTESGYYGGTTTGAFPASWTQSINPQGNVPRVNLRVA